MLKVLLVLSLIAPAAHAKTQPNAALDKAGIHHFTFLNGNRYACPTASNQGCKFVEKVKIVGLVACDTDSECEALNPSVSDEGSEQ